VETRDSIPFASTRSVAMFLPTHARPRGRDRSVILVVKNGSKVSQILGLDPAAVSST